MKMIGEIISRYLIEEKLGEGGMGEVYLAHDTELDRKVVLKFLPPRLTDDELAIRRFRREAKAAAVLNHPNVVTVHDFGEDGGRTFLVMEYVQGSSLRDLIELTLPTSTRSDLVIPVASKLISNERECVHL